MTLCHALYLDWNATAPVLPEVVETVCEHLRINWGNPDSPHQFARSSGAVLAQARSVVGDFMGRSETDIVFTSGATESNQIALTKVNPERERRLVSRIEHPSVIRWGTDFIDVDQDGVVKIGHLDELLRAHAGNVAVVSVMAANNETGVLQPTRAIFEVCRKYNVPFHCDATQIVGRLDWDLSSPDLVSLSAHKFGGPKGVGVLASSASIHTQPNSGKQERGRRSGTVNVPGVAGMATALSHVRPQDSEGRDQLEAAAVELGGVVVSGGASRLPNTSCVAFPVPGDILVMALDLAGLACSTGSACASGAPGRSHVMEALGVDAIPVRFSLGPGVDVSGAIECLRTVYQRVQKECV